LMTHSIRRYVMGAIFASLLVACGPQMSTGPQIRAETVWSRPSVVLPTSGGMEMGKAVTESMSASPAMGATGAVYLKLVNDGGQPDRLIGARSVVATVAEIHESLVENNVTTMRPVAGGLEIPAKGQVELKPGSYHIMLMGLNRDLKPGDIFTVTLQLEKTGDLTVQSTVREP
jgi:periplasmic copper chaperone A